MNKKLFVQNRKKIGLQMKDNSILIMFAGKPPHMSSDDYYAFNINYNFFYSTGLSESGLVLVVVKKNGEIKERIFINRYDPRMALWVEKPMTVKTVRSKSGITDVAFVDELDGYMGNILRPGDISNVYFDFFQNDFTDMLSWENVYSSKLKEKYPYINIMNISPIIASFRRIKTRSELYALKKAIEVTRLAIEKMMKKASVCKNEADLLAYFIFEATRHSHVITFPPIVASGNNATTLHYTSNNAVISPNSLVLADVGLKRCPGYPGSDISRTFPICGKFTKKQKEIYEIVLTAQEEVIRNVKPGVSLGHLQGIAIGQLAKGCINLELIKDVEELSSIYYHGVSHHLGLDAHDGISDREALLEPGMVITVEPGLYIKKFGIGIRIEDVVHVTSKGCVNLSKGIIKDPDQIENFMDYKK